MFQVALPFFPSQLSTFLNRSSRSLSLPCQLVQVCFFRSVFQCKVNMNSNFFCSYLFFQCFHQEANTFSGSKHWEAGHNQSPAKTKTDLCKGTTCDLGSASSAPMLSASEVKALQALHKKKMQSEQQAEVACLKGKTFPLAFFPHDNNNKVNTNTSLHRDSAAGMCSCTVRG